MVMLACTIARARDLHGGGGRGSCLGDVDVEGPAEGLRVSEVHDPEVVVRVTGQREVPFARRRRVGVRELPDNLPTCCRPDMPSRRSTGLPPVESAPRRHGSRRPAPDRRRRAPAGPTRSGSPARRDVSATSAAHGTEADGNEEHAWPDSSCPARESRHLRAPVPALRGRSLPNLAYRPVTLRLGPTIVNRKRMEMTKVRNGSPIWIVDNRGNQCDSLKQER